VQEHGCEKEDRCVEIQHGGHERDEEQCGHIDGPRAEREPCEQPARRGEQSVFLRDDSDEEQSRHEHERRPDLRGGGVQAGQLVSSCWQNVRPSFFACRWIAVSAFVAFNCSA
jgi:hypothetical protein